MLQSCGRSTSRQPVSANFTAWAPGASPLKNFQLKSKLSRALGAALSGLSRAWAWPRYGATDASTTPRAVCSSKPRRVIHPLIRVLLSCPESSSFSIEQASLECLEANNYTSPALFQNHGRLRLMPVRRQSHGSGQNQRAAHPCIGAQVLAQQLYAKKGAHRRLNVQENPSPRSRYVMDAPVPQQCGGSRAQQSADSERNPCRNAHLCEWWRFHFLMSQRRKQPRHQNPQSQHRGPGENRVGSHHRRAVRLHQLFGQQNPG